MIFLTEPVVGICRFSFCGRGDWVNLRGVASGPALEKALDQQADVLYDDARMARRFRLFESLLLPSLKAQKDQHFILVVLTSARMPSPHLSRLKQICADFGENLILIVSDETSVHDAIMPTLSDLNRGLSRPLVQFRVDDDDCLSGDFVRELRKYMTALDSTTPLSYSRSNGLVVTHYSADGGAKLYSTHLPFNSMGTAIRVSGERSIFSFGHAALLHRFPAIVDNSGLGYICTKLDGHDSRALNTMFLENRSDYTLVDRDRAENLLSRWFGFLAEDGASCHDALMQRITAASR